MSDEHTGEPWFWREDPDNFQSFWSLENLDGKVVAFAINDVRPSDRKVIAMAPELLAACKDCMENRGDWMKRMAAAVAKAEAAE